MEKFRKQIVLVTGAAGFIGSCLVSSLKNNPNYTVVPCTRGYEFDIENLTKIKHYNWDVVNSINPSYDGNVDIIIHCATANDIVSRDFQKSLLLNVSGTKNVLEYAQRNSIKKFIYLSTIQLFGKELKGTITNYTENNCDSLYSLSHSFGEELCRLFSLNSKFKIIIARPTNVYGVPLLPTIKRNTLVPKSFVIDSIVNGSITLNSSGNQYRNFIHNDELSLQILSLINNDSSKNFIKVILSSHLIYSIKDVAELVAIKYQELTNKKLPIYFKTNNFEKYQKFKFETFDYLNINPKEVSIKNFELIVTELLKMELLKK